MTEQRLFDAGAPLERTQMAWTRTGLAMLATSAISARLLLSEPLWLVTTVSLLGLSAGTACLLLGQRRYRLVQRDLWAATRGDPAVELPRAFGRGATASVVLLSALLLLGSACSVG